MNPGTLTVLLDSVDEAVILLDELFIVSYLNRSAQDFFNGNSLLGKNFLESIVDKDARTLKSTLFSNNYNKGELLLNAVKINDQIADIAVKSWFDEAGKKFYILNIRNFKSAERPRTFNLYKLLAENAYDINIMFEGNDMIYISPSLHDFLGYFEHEIKTLEDWQELIHPDDREHFFKELQSDADKKLVFSFLTYRQQHKNGKYIWFETKIKREFKEDGTIVNILTSMDINARKKFELELEKQKEFIEQLFDSDPNLIYVKDGNGQILYCNKAVADLVGMTRDEFLGLKDMKMLIPENQQDLLGEIENNVINKGKEMMLEEMIKDKDGVVHHFQTIKKPLRTHDGDITLLNISTNINQIKYYQKENEKAIEAKTEFFSAMSHEIRTPMNAIIGITELLLSRAPKEDQVKLLENLNFSATSLLTLINDILDLSKIEAGKLELDEVNYDIHKLLNNIRTSFQTQVVNKGISLGFSLDESVPVIVKGDAVKLSQILNNLLSNAIKFTEEGKVQLKAAVLSSHPTYTEVLFEVKDSGIGIEKERLDDIFLPYNQADSSTNRKFGGTGLGLSIVKNLVELHNGKLKVISELGEGSTFQVILPIKHADKKQEESELSASISIKDFKWNLDLDVLYAEDVPTNQFLVKEILSDWGINVDIANDGKEALAKMKSKKYDVVLMDIQMPIMDGFEALQKIKELNGLYANVPVIALTADATDATRKKVFNAGFSDLLTKPINTALLHNKLAKLSGIEPVIAAPKFDVEPMSIEEIELDENRKAKELSFTTTDKLFYNNSGRYEDFLKKTVLEFKEARNAMIKALEENKVAEYRKIHHKLQSLLSILQAEELSITIVEIKKDLLNNEVEVDVEYASKRLSYNFDYITDMLSNRLSSLKWQRV